MHLRKLPSGNWRVDVKVGERRASGSARTKSEARQVGAELALGLGGSPQASADVAELLATWFACTDLSITYRADAMRVVDKLPATFTKRNVATVTTPVVEGLYRQLTRDGWSEHRIARAHAVLSSAYTLACRYGWANSNPFGAARKPPVTASKVRPPTETEVLTLLERADERFRLYLLVATSLGARRGEVVGLQWQDVTDDSIIIRRSLAYAPTAGVQTTEGKTGKKGHRVAAIDQGLIHLLRAHQYDQAELARQAGVQPVWVFSHDAGATPWRPDFASREFRNLRNGNPDNGIPKVDVRLHDLRHYVATQLLAAGVPLKTVADRLGHRQLATTSDTYGDYVPAADRVSADIMANLTRRPTP
jgi:integrase